MTATYRRRKVSSGTLNSHTDGSRIANGRPAPARRNRNAMRRRSGEAPQVCSVTETASTSVPDELIRVTYAKVFHVAFSALSFSAASPRATASSPS